MKESYINWAIKGKSHMILRPWPTKRKRFKKWICPVCFEVHIGRGISEHRKTHK